MLYKLSSDSWGARELALAIIYRRDNWAARRHFLIKTSSQQLITKLEYSCIYTVRVFIQQFKFQFVNSESTRGLLICGLSVFVLSR